MFNWFSNDGGDRQPRENRVLDFDLPAYRQQLKKPPQISAVIARTQDLARYPLQALWEVQQYLLIVNRNKLPIAKRFELTEQCFRYACPFIRTIYSDHSKGHVLPEIKDRREALLAVIDVCQELGIGFKRVLMHDFDLQPRKMIKVKERISDSAFYVFELTAIEQRVRATRYQYLPKSSWQHLNQIYFNMRKSLDVSYKRKMLACLTPKIKSNSLERPRLPEQSLTNLYVAIQLFGFMDTNTLSIQQMRVVDILLKQVLGSTKIQQNAVDSSHLLFVYENLDRPPYHDAQEFQEVDPWIMDVSTLTSLLDDEYERSVFPFTNHKFDIDNPNEQLLSVTDAEDIEKLLGIEVMQYRLKGLRRAEGRISPPANTSLYIYNGFTTSFKLLSAIREGGNDTEADNQLRDLLAQRSALIVDSDDDAELGKWIIVNESGGGILLETRETQFTSHLFIGQLVAYAHNRDELREPSLAYVCRMQRSGGTNIQISLLKFASKVQVTSVQNTFLQKNSMALPGILVLDDEERLGLVLHFSHRLLAETPVTISREGERHAYKIQRTEIMQREFIFYQLQGVELEH